LRLQAGDGIDMERAGIDDGVAAAAVYLDPAIQRSRFSTSRCGAACLADTASAAAIVAGSGGIARNRHVVDREPLDRDRLGNN